MPFGGFFSRMTSPAPAPSSSSWSPRSTFRFPQITPLPRSVPARDVGLRAVAGAGLGMGQLRTLQLAPAVAVPLRRGAGAPEILPTELPNTTTPGASIIAEKPASVWPLVVLGVVVLWLAS